MASEIDDSDFVDSDYQAARRSAYAAASAGVAGRPPTREELESRVNETQQRLQDLKRAQEELERERAGLEEARRRRTEFHVGRDEMLQELTRGIGILEEAEFAARRDAEQMAKSLGDLRDFLVKVQSLNDQAWVEEDYQVELTRALTTIENARMEWNAARLKWPILEGETAEAGPPPAGTQEAPVSLGSWSFPQLCKLGLALTWPMVVLALTGLAVALYALLTR